MSATTFGERWYVVHTQTGCEDKAALHLRRQGFEVFLPRSYRTIRHARQIRTTLAAFFPAYLFVRVDLEARRWRSIEGTRGVKQILKAGDRPLPAPTEVVATLLAASDECGVLDLSRDVQPGAQVRLISGPFADQFAVVERLNSADRVRVLLSIMNQPVPLEVGRRALAVV